MLNISDIEKIREFINKEFDSEDIRKISSLSFEERENMALKATKEGKDEDVALLLLAPYDDRLNYGAALLLAASIGNKDLCYEIVKFDDNAYACIEALFVAHKKGHEEICEYLCKYLVMKGNVRKREEILEVTEGKELMHPLMFDKTDADLNDALKTAVQKESIEICEYLIQHGADDLNGALLITAQIGNIEIFKYLIKKGANDFDTALFYATDSGKEEVCKYLIEVKNNIINRKSI